MTIDMFYQYYKPDKVTQISDFYGYLRIFQKEFIDYIKDDNKAKETVIGKELFDVKKRGNSRLGNRGRGYLMKTYHTENNNSLPSPVKKLITEYSSHVITHLETEGLL